MAHPATRLRSTAVRRLSLLRLPAVLFAARALFASSRVGSKLKPTCSLARYCFVPLATQRCSATTPAPWMTMPTLAVRSVATAGSPLVSSTALLTSMLSSQQSVSALDLTSTPAEDPNAALLLLAPFQLLALYYVYKGLKKIEES
eukprot:TRINITY_DN41374_c0_g1_i1.p1 TRINITY_DN41374_c0_g1~~TRINITY_DN41374_c0_g1_i1.p1  ORF type:complete len:145 (+),score=21.21 TRINITY_DN41374_c0_g1_i1:81-515(+)